MTGVILNWKRPRNVLRILASWRSSGLIEEAIVWNNNPQSPFSHSWAKVVNANTDLGLYTRFAAACLATNDAVLIQDDDLELPHAGLAALGSSWQADREVVHGIFGRRPRPDGSYALDVRGNCEVPVVLTRALVAHRRLAAEFLRVVPAFSSIQARSMPFGNGEDIIFSYVARRLSGRLNCVHKLDVFELPAPASIHGRNWQAHIRHRTRVMRACEAWLDGD